MTPRRDPFANFERMRRDVNELFEDVFERAGLSPRKPAGFRPRVDIYLCDQPRRVIVKADLAGIDADSVNVEIQGRTLILSGERRLSDSGGRIFQQIEIEHGPFKRAVQLSVDVDQAAAKAKYEDGILRIEIPIAEAGPRSRQVHVSREQAGEKKEEGPGT